MRATDMWTMVQRLNKMSEDQLLKVFKIESLIDRPSDIMRYAIDKYSADEISNYIEDFDNKYLLNAGDVITIENTTDEFVVTSKTNLDGYYHIVSVYDGSGFDIESYRCNKTGKKYILPWLEEDIVNTVEEETSFEKPLINDISSNEDDFYNRDLKIGEQISIGFEEGIMNPPAEEIKVGVAVSTIDENIDPFDLFC